MGDISFGTQSRKTIGKFKTSVYHPPSKKLFRKPVYISGCESNDLNDEFGALLVV